MATEPRPDPMEHANHMAQAFDAAKRRWPGKRLTVNFNPQTKVFRVCALDTGEEFLRADTWEEFWGRITGDPVLARQAALLPTDPTHTRREAKRTRRRR